MKFIECQPHALHSIDPQGGVDLAEVKARVGDTMCLVGNVNCALLQSGSEAEVVVAFNVHFGTAWLVGAATFSVPVTVSIPE
ncbi:MAG: hypothetical protein L3J71_17470 [Victivallaceae bacterium]|nr:hypothetical protein [Victivallaceae bacterium]